MTELEKLKLSMDDVCQGVGAYEDTIEAAERLLDRAYALGKAERGEKMPIVVRRCDPKFTEDTFEWATYKVFCGPEGHVYEFMRMGFTSNNAAIRDAEKFWSRFGVEIEIVGDKDEEKKG